MSGSSPRPTRVALALGGGGARGYAHIGVIRALEERDYRIVSVAGTSMGAVIGGLHAVGRLEDYERWVRTLSQRDVIRLMDPTLKGPGAIRAEKVLARVTELVAGAMIEDLPIRFTAIATDLRNGNEVWFQEGPVDVAIRASMALPPFITPVMLGGRLLADGGLSNPIPVAATRTAAADLTLAVSLAGDPFTEGRRTPVQTSSNPEDPDHHADDEGAPTRARREAGSRMDLDLTSTITGWFSGLSGATAVDAAPEEIVEDLPAQEDDNGFGPLPPGLRTLDVMRLSVDAMQQLVLRYRLAGYPPDVIVSVPRSAARTLDFHRAAELIELGYQRTVDALDAAEANATNGGDGS